MERKEQANFHMDGNHKVIYKRYLRDSRHLRAYS